MSFFDDPSFINPSNFEICKTYRYPFEINMKKKILHEGELILKPTSETLTTKYFRIFDRKLVFFSSKTTKTPKGYYDLMNFLKIVIIDSLDSLSKKNFPAFRLEKFGKFHEFAHKDINEINKWVRVLRLYCISNDFESRYERQSILGKGHFAKVFKVKSFDNECYFAAKIMSKDQKFEDQKTYVYNEIKILKNLPKRPNIIKLFEIYDSKLELILIFEYIEGGDLYQLLKKTKLSPLSLETMSSIFSQIIIGLNFLHSRNIMHRDIKPENILLSESNGFKEVKIADFSLAEDFSERNIKAKCGTPGYMAPEIFLKKPYDEKVDIYSLGIVLFMMLTKKSPFKGKDAKDILNKNKQNIIMYKKSDWMNIDESLRRMVYDLTIKDPNDRVSLQKITKNNWIKHHFKDITEESKYNNKINGEKSLKENKTRADLEFESFVKSKGASKVLSLSNNSSQKSFLNAGLNSINSLFIGTNGTSENSMGHFSPTHKSFHSNNVLESPKILNKSKKSEENEISLEKIKRNKEVHNFPISQHLNHINHVSSLTEKQMFTIFPDENPVKELMKKLGYQEKKAIPSKNFRF